MCTSCASYEEHHSGQSECVGIDDVWEPCELCLKHVKHCEAYRAAREAYIHDRENNSENSYSVDLEKVLLLPHMPFYKECIFTRRVVMFNETFAKLGGDGCGAPLAVIWHEGICGRNDDDITSSWIKALHYIARVNPTISKVVLWADNCTAQNKNWTLFGALTHFVNLPDCSIDSIEVKYLEPGHTFNSADSFHHKVELSIKKSRFLYDFNDFVTAVAMVGLPLVMSVTDFVQWPNAVGYSRAAKQRPLIENIKSVRFERGSIKMEWKESHAPSAEYKSSSFLRLNDERLILGGCALGEHKTAMRGISISKYNGIIAALGRLMPKAKLYGFWTTFPTTEGNVADLIDSNDG